MKIDAAIGERRLARAGLHDADVRAARGRRDRDIAEPLPVAQDVAWRTAPVEEKVELQRVHGDQMLDTRGSSRPMRFCEACSSKGRS